MVAQDVDRRLVGRPRQPRVDRADRALVQGRGQEQTRQEVLAGGVEERVGARTGVTRPGGEVLCELGGPDLVGDVGQRVPPPGGFLAGDLLRVEDPHRAGARSHVAGGIDDVALVRGDQHRAGGVQDGRYGARRGLARAGAPDVDVHVFPGPEQGLVAAHRSTDRHARRGGDAQSRGAGGGALATQRFDVAAAPHEGRSSVDAGAPAPRGAHETCHQDRESSDDQAEAGEHRTCRPRATRRRLAGGRQNTWNGSDGNPVAVPSIRCPSWTPA